MNKAKPPKSAKTTKTLSLSPSVKAKLLAAEKAKSTAMETITAPTSPLSSSKFTELVPFIACLVQPEDFEEALASTYSQIYVPTIDGYLKHMKLAGGRHVRIKVDSIPTVKGKRTPPVIQENLNFLPAGKIPYEYFDQIVMFFREVVRLKKMEYEAHAWILWSKERGYFISIPKQTVSKAAVSFAYDEDALPKGSVIVVDLHSHNTMGSFFSGTDNNNDKTGIYYSGVIGNLTPTAFTHVIRFNLNEHKMACTLDDIFETKKSEVTIPNEWLDKVQVAAPTFPNHHHTGIASYKNRPGYKPYGRGTQEVFPTGKGKWTAASSINGPDEVIEPSFWDKIHSQVNKNSMDEYYDQLELEATRNRRKQELKNLVDSSGDNELSDIAEAHIAAMKEEQRLRRQITAMGHNPDGDDIGWDDPANYEVMTATGSYEGEEESLGLDRETDEPQDAEPRSIYYDEFLEGFGEDCAEAYDLIDSFMADLEGCDKGLLDIARQAYGLMTEKGRTELETNGL